jgi:hypothetical protein
MKVFDHSPTNVRHEQSYPMSAPNHSAAWIASIVFLAAIIIGAFVYEHGGAQQSMAPTATHEMTQPPPVNPPPLPAKP